MKSPSLAFASVAFLVATLFSASVGANNGKDHDHGDRPTQYKYVTIDVPGSRSTSAMGIDDAGDVVGSFRHAQIPGQFSFTDAFLLKNGEFTTIEFPHAPGEKPDTTEAAWDINKSGTVVGVLRPGRGMLEGFQYSDGIFTVISTPEFQVQSATGINDHGTIVGDAFLFHENVQGAYFLRNGVFTRFTVPGATSTRVYGINNAEEVVGEYSDAQGRRHVFFSRGAEIKDITPDGTDIIAYSLNDRGEIVGTANTEEGQRGFLMRHGKFTLIQFPDAVATQTFGINNHGVIVGEYRDTNGVTHGFKAIPHQEGRHGGSDKSDLKNPHSDFNGKYLMLPF